MAFRHRTDYDESVPAALLAERAAYDEAMTEHERAIARARARWGNALASAIEAGMSYAEITEAAGVSHSSISRALKDRHA